MPKAFNGSGAAWIWHHPSADLNVVAVFNDFFSVPAGASVAMNVAVDGNYCLKINGSFAACGQYNGYEDLKYYDALDLTPYVKEGRNEMILEVWRPGRSSFSYRLGKAGVLYEITSGHDVLAVSRPGVACWTSTAHRPEAENVTPQLGFTVRYDATRAGERLNEGIAALASDKEGVPLPRPVPKLTVSKDKPVSLIQRGSFLDTRSDGAAAVVMQSAYLRTDSIVGSLPLPSEEGQQLRAAEGATGCFALIDVGEEDTGVYSLDIEVPVECDVYTGWGEHLADLRVRTAVGGRNFAVVTHLPAGRTKLLLTTLRFGLRYLQLHVYAPEATLHYAGIRQTHYPLSHVSVFTCADSLHNRIEEVSRRTLHMCMHEHYEDCPWREQALYCMDSRNQMLCGYYAFGETAMPRASLTLMAHSLREDRLLELISPGEAAITIPSFSAIFPVQLQEYVSYSGDVTFGREMLPTVDAILGGFSARLEENGLIRTLEKPKDWNFYEWQDGLAGSISGDVPEEKRRWEGPLCGFLALAFRSAAAMCDLIGEAEKAADYRARHAALTGAMQAFWDDEKQAYCSYIDRDGVRSHYCELTNALFFCAKAVPQDRQAAVLEALASDRLIPVTLSHSVFKYEALLSDMPRYGRFVFGQVAQLWGSMLAKDATTFWETIDGEPAFGNAGSLCHGWSAIPLLLYHKYALTADPALTGLYECRLSAGN